MHALVFVSNAQLCKQCMIHKTQCKRKTLNISHRAYKFPWRQVNCRSPEANQVKRQKRHLKRQIQKSVFETCRSENFQENAFVQLGTRHRTIFDRAGKALGVHLTNQSRHNLRKNMIHKIMKQKALD